MAFVGRSRFPRHDHPWFAGVAPAGRSAAHRGQAGERHQVVAVAAPRPVEVAGAGDQAEGGRGDRPEHGRGREARLGEAAGLLDQKPQPGPAGPLDQHGLGHAFLWRNGRMRDLGTLGGAFSEALEVNNHGVVVGNSETASGALRPFRWWRGRHILDLGALGEGPSRALGVNNRVWVVGDSEEAGGGPPTPSCGVKAR
jgi:probable HAF family extracellular repeat protein